MVSTEALIQRCSVKKIFLEILQNSHESFACVRVPFLIKLTTLLKKRLIQVFSHEFFEISQNTFFTEHLWATVSVSICSFFLLSVSH